MEIFRKSTGAPEDDARNKNAKQAGEGPGLRWSSGNSRARRKLRARPGLDYLSAPVRFMPSVLVLVPAGSAPALGPCIFIRFICLCFFILT